MTIRRGDILWADLGMFPTTSVQGGVRPVIVVSNNKANTYSSVITVVPLTSRIYKKRYLPTHVFISKYDMTGIRKGSLALAEQVMSISTKCIIEKCGRVNKWSLDRVLKAVRIQMGMEGEGHDGRRNNRNYLEQDFSDVDINEMTDLRMIKADRNKSLQERRDIFLNKVGNPYLVRIGNMKVKVRFANNGISMEQAFENMLLSV